MSDGAGSTGIEYSDVEYVFEANRSSVEPWGDYVRDIWARRRFIQALAQSQMRSTVGGTVMGELWNVIDPLIQAGIYWFVLSVIRSSAGRGSVDYLTMIIGGVFLFKFVSVAISEGGRAIVAGKGLMLNSSFPRAMLPIAAVYRGLLQFLPAVPVYIVFHLALRAPVGPGIALLPLLFLLEVMLAVGLALLVSTATVIVRDIQTLLNYIMRVLIFVTPVIYPASTLPPVIQTILGINPLFALFSAYQVIIAGGVPSAWQIIQAMAWATVLLVVGARLFRKHEFSFALYL